MTDSCKNEFLIYDLETFDIKPKYTWVAQFAARRYDSDFNPLDNGTILYCKLAEDHVPSLDACVLTGITPQYANEHGDTELEFARKTRSVLMNKSESTIIAGYNNTTFDNWVINNLLFRNFLQPYEPFRNRSLDCFTITKAVHHMRKDALKYMQVQKEDGSMRDSLKLEHLSKANNLIHTKAHDALSDVEATAGMFALIKRNCNEAYEKYLSCSRRDNPARFLESAAKSSMPVMAVTRSALSDSSFTTLAVILGSDVNSFYCFDLLCPESKFNENLSKLMEAQEKDKAEYVSLMHGFCHTIKVNEGPFTDYPEKYYAGQPNEKDTKELMKTRLEKLDSIRKTPYVSTNSFRRKKGFVPASSGNGCETASGSEGQSQDSTIQVEETLLDGFLNNEAAELMEIAEKGSPDDMRKALSSMKNMNLSLRVRKLFSHMIARNYPELYSKKALAKWHEYVKSRLIEQRDAFVADYNRLVKSELPAEKMQIVKEVCEYEKEIFDRFSLRLL